MRLRFLLKRRSQDGSQLPPLGHVFFVDPLKTPTVASVADFVRKKCNVETEVNFYLDGYLVDPTDSVAVFDHDDVITVCSKDFPETPEIQENRADVTETSTAGGLHENSNVMRSILKKRKTVSICAVRSEDEGDEPSFANPNVSMLVNLPATPPADISFPNISNKKRKLDEVESDESSEEESSDDEPSKRAKKPVVEEESSEEESTDDEPPKPPVGKKLIPVKVSSEEESSDEELPKPPAGLLKKPSVESEESDSEEEEEEEEKSAVLETSTAVAGGSDVSSQALAQKKKRKRKRGSRGKKKAPEEQKKAAQTPKNDTINLSSDVSRNSDTRLPKDEWDKLRRNKRLATVKFVPASFNNRNKHVRFEPDRPEGGDESEKKVVKEVEKMDVSVASNGGGFGGNGSFSAGRFSDVSGDLSKRFPTPGGFPTRTPSASSTPLRLMPRQIRMPRLSGAQGWSVSKNSPQQPSPLAATTPSSSPVIAAGSRTMSSPAVVKSPLDSALKTVHLNESQTNKSRVYRSPLATVDNKSTGELNDKDLKEPFDMGSDEETEEPVIVEVKQKVTTNGGEGGGKKKYEEYPTLRPKQPKKGDKIAFKILEMSVDMCPEISDYKEGVVLDYNPSADAISFEVTVEPKPQTEDEENVGASLQNGVGIEILDAKWTNVIDPRLII